MSWMDIIGKLENKLPMADTLLIQYLPCLHSKHRELPTVSHLRLTQLFRSSWFGTVALLRRGFDMLSAYSDIYHDTSDN